MTKQNNVGKSGFLKHKSLLSQVVLGAMLKQLLPGTSLRESWAGLERRELVRIAKLNQEPLI
jgi:hypothetical protein